MMSSFHDFNTFLEYHLFYVFKMRTFRVAFFNEHAGTQVDDIYIMFQEAVHEPEYSSSRASSACKKADDLRILAIPGKMHFFIIECLEACHARTDLAYDITSHNGDFCGPIIFFHLNPYVVISMSASTR